LKFSGTSGLRNRNAKESKNDAQQLPAIHILLRSLRPIALYPV